jgi:hypothetical protein
MMELAWMRDETAQAWRSRLESRRSRTTDAVQRAALDTLLASAARAVATCPPPGPPVPPTTVAREAVKNMTAAERWHFLRWLLTQAPET